VLDTITRKKIENIFVVEIIILNVLMIQVV